MNGPDIEFDHIGIAVETVDKAKPFWAALGYACEGPRETVTEQKVTVEMLPLRNNSNIELLEPLNESSTVAQFLKKRGPGIHHICLRVKNIDQILKDLKSKGIRLINETAVKGAHGARVAFVHPFSTGGVLVELSENSAHGKSASDQYVSDKAESGQSKSDQSKSDLAGRGTHG